jgi:hypothetical protein
MLRVNPKLQQQLGLNHAIWSSVCVEEQFCVRQQQKYKNAVGGKVFKLPCTASLI